MLGTPITQYGSGNTMVSIDIICGLLGSGKTTLIKRLLETQYLGERVAIVENEYGCIGFDAEELRSEGITIKKLSSGCVCCTLRGVLSTGVRELIATAKPDRIIIEPSGVADIQDLLAVCKSLTDVGVCRVITVVNAMKVARLLRACGELFKNQVKCSCCVYLNFTEEMNLQEICAVHTQLLDLKPDLLIVDTPLNELERDTFPAVITPEMAGGNVLRQHFLQRVGLKEGTNFSYCCFKFFAPFTTEAVQMLIDAFPRTEFGDIHRCKGLLELNDGQIMKLDYVFGDPFCKIKADYSGETNLLTVIGRNLNQSVLWAYMNSVSPRTMVFPYSD